MNKTVLMGRVCKDIELKYTNNNTPVASFTVAVNRRFKKEGQPDADFINIVAWGKTAEFVSKYFSKGQQIGIVGRIETRSYDDKDGKKVYVTEVIAEEAYFAGDKKDAQTEGNTPVEDEDLPF